MAPNPIVTGRRTFQSTFNSQPTTPFAGVTITDPTPGAIDTVNIAVAIPGTSASLQDGPGFTGLMPIVDYGAAHIFTYYSLQGTSSQVTMELDALVLKPESAPSGNPADHPTSIRFSVASNSGASSPNYGIDVENVQNVQPDQRTDNVQTPDQTVALQPFDVVFNHIQAGTQFVFTQGDGIDVVRGFRVGGAGYDTLNLPSSDFRNFADVLRNTGDIGGSAFITDPKTGDAIRLAGVTTAELKANAKDIAFYR